MSGEKTQRMGVRTPRAHVGGKQKFDPMRSAKRLRRLSIAMASQTNTEEKKAELQASFDREIKRVSDATAAMRGAGFLDVAPDPVTVDRAQDVEEAREKPVGLFKRLIRWFGASDKP